MDSEYIIKRGKIAWAAYQEGLHKEMMYPRYWLNLQEFKILGITIKHSRFRNDIGHMIAQESKDQGGSPCGAVAYVDKRQRAIKVSLRSLEEFDASNIACEFGGGGHVHAASFSIDEQTLNSLKSKKRRRGKGR